MSRSTIITLTLLIVWQCFVHSYSSTFVDLTWEFNEKTVYWPGVKNFHFSKVTADTGRGYWYSAKEFCASEHGGTHLDAPYHFSEHGWKVGEIPLQRFITNGALVEVQDSFLQVKHLENWTEKNGPFPENSVILIKFNWSSKYHNITEYLGLDVNGNLNFPGISKEAAEWIADIKTIVGVGVDTASVDAGSSTDFWAHRILSAKQIFNLENVKLLETLPANKFKLFTFPMKIEDGTGAPVRIVAQLP